MNEPKGCRIGTLLPVPAWRCIGLVPLLLGLLAQGASSLGPERLDSECGYGITLAFSGNLARAESVFISLLSHSPGDPRALTNLGNLEVMRGDPGVALVFYDRAAKSDTADAGIVLNRAVALMLLGDQDAAESQARYGIAKAGGEQDAASLLGLRSIEQEPPARDAGRSTEKPYVAKSEIAALLSAALRNVPPDSSRAQAQSEEQPKAKESARKWRSAGTRSARENVVVHVLYWKR